MPTWPGSIARVFSYFLWLSEAIKAAWCQGNFNGLNDWLDRDLVADEYVKTVACACCSGLYVRIDGIFVSLCPVGFIVLEDS